MGSITGPFGWQKFETYPDWGAKISFSECRYLIDFITGISGAFSGFAPLDSDPSVDSNHSALVGDAGQLPNGRRSARQRFQ